MEHEHAIPQQMSSYQFKLVGDMTLKQFAQVAGGAIVALLFYASPLHPYLKWPLIIFSFLFGIGLAFFPLEDRPLDKWIVLFFKSIYTPTIFLWVKQDKDPAFFQPETAVAPATAIRYTSVPVTPVVNQPITKPVVPTPPIETIYKPKVVEEKTTPSTIKTFVSTIQKENLKTEGHAHAPVTAQAGYKPKVSIPKAAPVTVEHQIHNEMTTPLAQQEKEETETLSTITPIVGEIFEKASEASFSPDAAPPLTPQKGNIIVGQVIDPDGKIVEGAILEIRDSNGRPTRAVKSNKLGHFMIVTPLANGNYQIITEKDGLLFEPLSFEAAGAVIPPIAIWAKSRQGSQSIGNDLRGNIVNQKGI